MFNLKMAAKGRNVSLYSPKKKTNQFVLDHIIDFYLLDQNTKGMSCIKIMILR
jgi:hypothetical protein